MSYVNIGRWAREQFSKYRGAVACVCSRDHTGNHHCGTAFHVGEGVFVTARHVVENLEIIDIGFDDIETLSHLVSDPRNWGPKKHGSVNLVDIPRFHVDSTVDVACFRVNPFPEVWMPLGGHLDDFLGQHELVLYQTLVLGFPPIPFTNEPRIIASVGEVNALVELRGHKHPHFIISSMARGGFSGGPVLVAYNEENENSGTAVLGLVTESLTCNEKPPEQGYFAVLTVEPIVDCLKSNSLLPRGQSYDRNTDN